VERIDLIQLHNLVDEHEWETALGPGGALEALVEARAQGLVRFIGVTGHGTRVAAMHRRSLERFPFDAVLLPYNFTMMAIPGYAADVEALVAVCRERGVAVQTIKAIARRRWQDDTQRRFSWYEPLKDPDAIARAVRFVLGRSELFLNSSSDATLLRLILDAATHRGATPCAKELEADMSRYEMATALCLGWVGRDLTRPPAGAAKRPRPQLQRRPSGRHNERPRQGQPRVQHRAGRPDGAAGYREFQPRQVPRARHSSSSLMNAGEPAPYHPLRTLRSAGRPSLL